VKLDADVKNIKNSKKKHQKQAPFQKYKL